MNPVTWFSIPSDDINRSAQFYKQAFNWDLLPETREDDEKFNFIIALNSDSDEEFVSYERGRINGCLVKKQTGISTPVVLVEVDNLDVASKKVIAAGGTVVSDVIPMKSLNGSFVLVKDIDGNMLELFASNNKSIEHL